MVPRAVQLPSGSLPPFDVVSDQLSAAAVNKFATTETSNVNSTHGTASNKESSHSLPSNPKQKGAAAFGPGAKRLKDEKNRMSFISNLEDALKMWRRNHPERVRHLLKISSSYLHKWIFTRQVSDILNASDSRRSKRPRQLKGSRHVWLTYQAGN